MAFYILDCARVIAIQRGVPWQLIHHVGAIVGAITLLWEGCRNPDLIKRGTILLVDFEFVTLILNLSIAYPSLPMRVIFLASAVFFRGYGFVKLYAHMVRTGTVAAVVGATVAGACVVSHNIAYGYHAYVGTPDMLTLFG